MQKIPWNSVEEEGLSERIRRRAIHGGNISLALFQLAKGAVVPLHSHQNEQMSYILGGTIKFFGSSGEIVAGKNEVITIPPNEEHGVEVLEDCISLDIFSPPRSDWMKGDDSYLRK
ncbi:MAG: cupin domain-containing protein [Deltaproteobacteria bacterium]|nr:cupin domain-containing protein [Deltaproteobacteria bacterium]